MIKKERDERGRIIIHDLNQIPDNMTEDEVAEFWDTHAMSEELLDATYIPEGEDDDELPTPRKESIPKRKSSR